jgi:hypothetical protein
LKEITKIRAEITEMEIEHSTKSMKQRVGSLKDKHN